MFNKLIVIVILTVNLALVSGCKHQKTQDLEKLSISIEESACEGECPVYSMIIHNTGKAEYEGKFNVIKTGSHDYSFDVKDVDALFGRIKELDFSSFQSLYDGPIMDLPETVITHKDHRIVIKDKRIIPDDLKELLEELQRLSRSTGFIN